MKFKVSVFSYLITSLFLDNTDGYLKNGVSVPNCAAAANKSVKSSADKNFHVQKTRN